MSSATKLLTLSITAQLLIMPPGMATAEPAAKGLPPKSEWLPGTIKRDENGKLYLAAPKTKDETRKKAAPTNTTQSTENHTKTLYKNWVTLSWSAPSKNTDGSTIKDLSGYKIYYWTHKDRSRKIRDVNNVLEYKLENLHYGEIYFFAITSYNSKNIESPYSDTVSVKLEKPAK